MTRLTELSVYLSSLNWHMYMCHEDYMKNNRKSCIGLVRDSCAVRRYSKSKKAVGRQRNLGLVLGMNIILFHESEIYL